MAEQNELLLARVKAAVLSRDYDLAARLYKQMIDENPNDAALLQELGSVYVKGGLDKQALAIYEKLIQKDTENVDVLVTMGGIYRRLERYEESLATLQRARKLNRKNTQAVYNLGFTYRAMERYDEAIACLEEVIEQDPSDVLTYNHIGAIYAKQGDYERAIDSYLRGLKIDPNHPILQLNLAKSYTALGEIDKAISSYEASLRSRPGWLEAIEGYSELLLKTDRVREAYDVLHNALLLNPKDAKMHTQLGHVYTRQSIFEDAKKEYKTALSYDEDYDSALLGLANAQEELSEHADALKTIQRAEAVSPDDHSIKKKAAHIMLSANEYAEAFHRISELREKNPKDVQTLSLLGQYYICNGDWDKVEACYKQIAQYDPSYTAHYAEGAKRFEQKGDVANAEKYLRIALEANPKDVVAMVSLAKLMEGQKKRGDALQLYTQANSLDSVNAHSKAAIQRLHEAEEVEVVDYVPTVVSPDDLHESMAAVTVTAATPGAPTRVNVSMQQGIAPAEEETDPFDEEWVDVVDEAAEPEAVPGLDQLAEDEAAADEAPAFSPSMAKLSSIEGTVFGFDQPPAEHVDVQGAVELQVSEADAAESDSAAAPTEETELTLGEAALQVADAFASVEALTDGDAPAADTAAIASEAAVADADDTPAADDAVALDAAPVADESTAEPADTGDAAPSAEAEPDAADVPAASGADNRLASEEDLRAVNDSAKKAEQAAAQAWEAALVAADSAQALTEAIVARTEAENARAAALAAAATDDSSREAAAPADDALTAEDDFSAFDSAVAQEEAESYEDATAEAEAPAADATGEPSFSDATEGAAVDEAPAAQEAPVATDSISFEDTLRVVNDSARKAERAAAQAWEAALVAADSVQAIAESMEAQAAAAETAVEAESEAAQQPEDAAADAGAQAAPAATSLQASRKLFEQLRGLCEYLPPEHYDSFMKSRTRLLLDYIVARLAGNAGLLQTASERRKELEAAPAVPKETAPAIIPAFGYVDNDDESSANEAGIQLVTHVVDDLLSLITAVPDENLRVAMNTATKELVEKLIAL